MKVYSIGRDTECDIVINDNSDVISRRHAVISVADNGKLTLTDTSFNGTYVNGIRISPNVPVPVTRKDSITFAHVAKLDWHLIPQPAWKRWLLPAGIAAGVLIIAGVVCAVCFSGGKSDPSASDSEPTVAVSDSVAQEKSDSTDKQKSDSTDKSANHRKDNSQTDTAKKDGAKKGKSESAKPKKSKSASDKKQSAQKERDAKQSQSAAKTDKKSSAKDILSREQKTQNAKPQQNAKSQQNTQTSKQNKTTRIH